MEPPAAAAAAAAAAMASPCWPFWDRCDCCDISISGRVSAALHFKRVRIWLYGSSARLRSTLKTKPNWSFGRVLNWISSNRTQFRVGNANEAAYCCCRLVNVIKDFFHWDDSGMTLVPRQKPKQQQQQPTTTTTNKRTMLHVLLQSSFIDVFECIYLLAWVETQSSAEHGDKFWSVNVWADVAGEITKSPGQTEAPPLNRRYWSAPSLVSIGCLRSNSSPSPMWRNAANLLASLSNCYISVSNQQTSPPPLLPILPALLLLFLLLDSSGCWYIYYSSTVKRKFKRPLSELLY